MQTTKRRRVRKVSFLLATLLMLVGVAACAPHDEDYHGKSDAIQCIYDRNGALKHVFPAGSDTYKGDDRDEVYEVPVSDRFYNIDTDDNIRDAGAPHFLTGFAKGDKGVKVVLHLHFKLNQSLACPQFVDQHLKRNIPQSVRDSDITDKMGFNVRNTDEAKRYTDVRAGDTAESLLARVPWAKFLNEKIAPSAQEVTFPLLKDYEKFALQFNYPINANEDGLLPCLEVDDKGVVVSPETIDTDADINKCTVRQAAGETTYEELATAIGTKLTSDLAEVLGGNYFCGVKYTPAKPEDCPDIEVKVISINLDDQQPVKDRQQLDAKRDSVKNAQETAALDQQLASDKAASDKTAADAAYQAQLNTLATNKLVRDANNADKIDAAKAQIDVIEAQKAVTEAQQAEDAAKAIAPCLAQTPPATGADCALLLSVLAGNPYPVNANGTNINVTPTP